MPLFQPAISLALPEDLPRICDVWEASVRASHDFLTEADIQRLIPLVENGLARFSPIQVLRDEVGLVIAFLGVAGPKIEMLFVHPYYFGLGAGRILTRFAVGELGAYLVDVNEQNAAAVGFYEHLGFRTFDRSELDAAGLPFPLLHMRLASRA